MGENHDVNAMSNTLNNQYITNINTERETTVNFSIEFEWIVLNWTSLWTFEWGSSAECITILQKKIISAVVWKDNCLVTLLSTFVSERPLAKMTRFAKAKKKLIQVPYPNAVTVYNKYMGGGETRIFYVLKKY